MQQEGWDIASEIVTSDLCILPSLPLIKSVANWELPMGRSVWKELRTALTNGQQGPVALSVKALEESDPTSTC